MTSLWKLWQATADRRASNRTVVIDADTGREWTCRELTTLAERIASSLGGRIVPICQPNSGFWLAAFLGVQKIGAAALPLDPSLPTEAQERTARRAMGGLPARSCCIKLTSGTTGDLKFVYCSAANLRADGEHIIRTMGIRPTDRNLASHPARPLLRTWQPGDADAPAGNGGGVRTNVRPAADFAMDRAI
jgi:acyl-CoA synthetase (AMP-forming)/AMP-acid ligase II